jgi:dGTPase
MVGDLVAETRRRIAVHGVRTIDDVRAAPLLAGFAQPLAGQSVRLKGFLARELYRHPRVVAVMDRARQIVRDLFGWYRSDPSLLPTEHRERFEAIGPRALSDYIAGMTDRFAVREHARISGRDWPDPAAGLLGVASEAGP